MSASPASAFDPAALFAHPIPDVRQRYTARDTILYALSLGIGADPLAPETLRHCLEDRLQAYPTQALVLGAPGFWLREAPAGVDWRRVLHGEQRLTLHHPLPPEGEVVGRSRVTALVDRGATGAILHSERRLETAAGVLLATALHSGVLRGHGGFGRDLGAPPAPLAPAPETPPAQRVTLPTRPEAALLYRLNGDWNPLHADPEVARGAGYDRPILHGLATFGLAARALIAALCPDAPERLRAIEARFAAPVFPGEALTVQIWPETNSARFRARVEGRGVVLSHGTARVAPSDRAGA